MSRVTGFALSLATLAAAVAFSPARFVSGDAPAQPNFTVGFGQAAVELSIAADGSVLQVEPLGAATPFRGPLVEAAGGWRFAPARDGEDPVETRVLVVGLFRPPELMVVGDPGGLVPPKGSPAVPTVVSMTPPLYPPNGVGDVVVVVEARVDETGRLAEAQVVRSGGGFDSAALDAARKWRFQPATRDGAAVPACVYLVLGFRQPVVVK